MGSGESASANGVTPVDAHIDSLAALNVGAQAWLGSMAGEKLTQTQSTCGSGDIFKIGSFLEKEPIEKIGLTFQGL